MFKTYSNLTDEIFETMETTEIPELNEQLLANNKFDSAINKIKLAISNFEMAGQNKKANILKAFINKIAGDDDYRFEEEKSGINERELAEIEADRPEDAYYDEFEEEDERRSKEYSELYSGDEVDEDERVFEAGYNAGVEDLEKDQWGDPLASYVAWLDYHKDENTLERWMVNKESYVRGYLASEEPSDSNEVIDKEVEFEDWEDE